MMKATPIFCNTFCSVREYEKKKMISLMMQLTKDWMLDEDDEQSGKVRSGYTYYFQSLYRCMILNSDTYSKKKNILKLKVPTEIDARNQCITAIRKEFNGINIPEWPNDRNLSETARRCNCMMLMACFIICKDYKSPAAYTKLLFLLNEIRELYCELPEKLTLN